MLVPDITYAFIAALAFSGLNTSAGYLTNILNIPVAQVILIRNSFVCAISFAYLFYHHVPDSPLGLRSSRRFWVLGGLGVAVSVMSGYASMFYLSLSEYITVRCMDPFTTALLCRIFVNERVTTTQIVRCSLSVIDIVLVTDPLGAWASNSSTLHEGSAPLDDSSPIPMGIEYKILGVMLAIPSSFGQATELLAMRKMDSEVSTAQVMVYMGFCPAVVATTSLVSTQTALVSPEMAYGWVVLFGVVPLGLIGQFCLIYAGQRVPGTQVSIALYSSVVFGVLIQWMVYGNHPSWTAYGGMIIIVACGLYAVVHAPDAGEAGVTERSEEDVEMSHEVNMPLLTSMPSGPSA